MTDRLGDKHFVDGCLAIICTYVIAMIVQNIYGTKWFFMRWSSVNILLTYPIQYITMQYNKKTLASRTVIDNLVESEARAKVAIGVRF